ncbi:MAG: ferritin-like domain-containing protein [Agitococcus sp.]|nr:ferritin-like domain-containing protein [Agitococcus sp.]MDO9177712.1 ferritin-like domain-containing protein [Agitococcus sp.]
MTIQVAAHTPNEVRYFPDADDIAAKLSEDNLQDIIEIFKTPLEGSYNWDYSSIDGRIRKLYRLGKELNWNQETDLNWDQNYPKDQSPSDMSFNPFAGYAPFETMSEEQKLSFAWHYQAWTLSQFLHGEQGALLVASQLVSCAPTFDAKLYASSQTFDEARHVETFNRYIQEKIQIMYPITPHLKSLIDKVLSDARWDLKFIGMQIVIEGLALAAFNTMRLTCLDPLLKDLIYLVTRDEARHVTFGVNYLEYIVQHLSPAEIEERAQFAYEACVVMRERLIATEVFAEFGWDVEAARKHMLESSVMQYFNKFLFTRIIPNLARIGLLTDTVRPKFEALGILEYENLVSDGDIDWATLSEPLYQETASEDKPAKAA